MKKLIAGLVLAGGIVTVANGQAHAATCGGNSTAHPAPIDCTNSVTVSGVTATAHLTVSVTGAIHVDAGVNTAPVPLYLQVKSHDGISSNAGFVGATAVLVNKQASVDLQMFGCLSQIDIKVVPGTPTLDHVDDKYRVAAPLVSIECQQATTTTIVTTTTGATTTVVTTTVPGTSPTTGPSVGSSVPGTSPGTLPTTGSGVAYTRALLAIAGLVAFGVILVALGRRKLPPPVS